MLSSVVYASMYATPPCGPWSLSRIAPRPRAASSSFTYCSASAQTTRSTALGRRRRSNVPRRAVTCDGVLARVDTDVANVRTQASQDEIPQSFTTTDVEDRANHASDHVFGDGYGEMHLALAVRFLGHAMSWMAVPAVVVGLVVSLHRCWLLTALPWKIKDCDFPRHLYAADARRLARCDSTSHCESQYSTHRLEYVRGRPLSFLYGHLAESAVAVRSRSRPSRIAAIVEDGFRLLPSLLVNVPHKQKGPRLDVPVEGERRCTF